MLVSHNISLLRQGSLLRKFDPKRGVSVATLAYEYSRGHTVAEHAHGADQLVYAIRGVMEVFSGKSMWLIPPRFALWIPAETYHQIRMPSAVSMRTLYLRPGLVHMRPMGSVVLHVTPLLRELILETVRIGKLRATDLHERPLRDLLIIHLETASPVPTFVELPSDARALAVAQAVLAAPEQAKSLAAFCRDAGVSVRTMQRIFRRDLDSDFETWRRQVRLTKAVAMLVSGQSVKEVAFAIGYRQASAFVESFRQTFGTTPKAWTVSLQTLHPER